jgi:ankyrin repeat protein
MNVYSDFHWSRCFRVRRILIALAGFCGCCRVEAAMAPSDYFVDKGVVALSEAAASGRSDVVTKLLAQGVNVNARGKDGMTLVILALLNQDKRGFECLLQHGAEPNLQLSDGESSLAKELPFAGNSAISFAARDKDIWYLDTALKYGGNVNLVNPYNNQTPIYASIAALLTLQPKRLIAAGANLNYQDSDGITPLLCAARANRFDLTYVMLMAGADPTKKNKWGKSVVDVIAKSMGHTLPEMSQWRERVIDVLRKKGIEVPGGQ